MFHFGLLKAHISFGLVAKIWNLVFFTCRSYTIVDFFNHFHLCSIGLEFKWQGNSVWAPLRHLASLPGSKCCCSCFFFFFFFLKEKRKRKEPLGEGFSCVVRNGERERERGPNVLVYRQHKLEKMGWCHCERARFRERSLSCCRPH